MPALTWGRSLLVFGILTGLASANAQVAAQGEVPDFSSNLAGWVNIDMDFLPVPGAIAPTRNNPAYPYVSNQEARRAGTQPTFRVADLTNPNVKPWAKEIMKRENDKVLAGGIAYTPRSSCMPAGVPGYIGYGGNQPFYFIQTPQQVWMVFSGDQQVRRVYLNAPHSAKPKPSWYGESVGRYEGDTLVVDTIGLNDKTFVDNFRTPHSEKLHVVERYRLVEGGRFLQAEVLIEDPAVFIEPLKVTKRSRRVETKLAEWRCAAGEINYFGYDADPVPTATTPDF